MYKPNQQSELTIENLIDDIDNWLKPAFQDLTVKQKLNKIDMTLAQYREKLAEQPQLQLTQASNLVSWLAASIGPNGSSASMDPARVCKILIEHFKQRLAVLDSDHSQLAVFDPYKGSWNTSSQLFNQLVQVIKPTASNNQTANIKRQLATYCVINDQYLRPYDGSRYVLFDNGVLDAKTNELSPLETSDALNFVSRNLIDLNYKGNPDMPIMDDSGYEWTPQKFLDLYTDGDKEKEQMLLFTLALSIFPNHGFGVNINYVSDNSNAVGKLRVILSNLTGPEIAEMPLDKLTEKFSLTNFNSDLSMIWANGGNSTDLSCNNELKSQYNALANGNFHVQVKNEKDVIFKNPPQLYVSSSTPIHDVPGVRTDVFVNTMYYYMPDISSDYDTSMLLNLSEQYLSRPSVLQWLVHKMLDAYWALAPHDDDQQFMQLKFKSTDARLLSLLPAEYQQWQHDSLAPKNQLEDEVDEFIRYNIVPNLSTEFGKPTMMHRLVAYKLFKRYYNLQHGVADAKLNDLDDKLSPSQLENMLKKYFNQNGYSTPLIKDKSGNPARRIVTKPSKMHFNFDAYIHDNGDPSHWFDDNHPIDPFGRKLNGWFQIYPTNKGGGTNG